VTERRLEGKRLLTRAAPLAYFVTFTCYGALLHGNDPLSVDRNHNRPGAPFVPPDKRREAAARCRMDQARYEMDKPRRQIVLSAIQEVAAYRGWQLLAVHVRTNHVHVVLTATAERPERVMNDFKAYASRKLTKAGFDGPGRKRWTRHGSTRYLWTAEEVEAAIQYVVSAQGEPMEVFDARRSGSSEPRG
jgi:REP element-mobilizing transposase RayT